LGGGFLDTTTILLISAVIIAVGVGIFFFTLPKEDVQWIMADGVKIQSISKDAKIVYVNNTMEKRVRELYQSGKLLAFRGESIGGGIDTVKARDKAKTNAYKELSEYFSAKISTFSQLVDGQIQAIASSGKANAESLKSTAMQAYKSVTEMFSSTEVSGTYIYAVWEEYVGSLVYTNVLLVFDPAGAIEAVKSNEQIAKQIDELGQNGVDFFKALNGVIEEAKK